MKKAVSDKLDVYAEDGRLKSHRYLKYLLSVWKSFGEGNKVKAFITDLLKNKIDCANFLISSVTIVTSTSFDGTIETKRKINKESLNDLYPINKISKIVDSISDSDMKKMNERQNEAIKLFREST